MPLWLRLTLFVVLTVGGYQRAVWFERRYGRTPWGWHPLGWAALTGFGGVIWLAIAERMGRSRARKLAATPAAVGQTFGPAVGQGWDHRFGPPPPSVGEQGSLAVGPPPQ